jgi:hypothetical protein
MGAEEEKSIIPQTKNVAGAGGGGGGCFINSASE